MGVIEGVGLWHLGPLPRGIGGLASKEPLRIMQRNVINVKDTPQIFISQGES